MRRIIDCSMLVSNETWRPRWLVNFGVRQAEKSVEVEGVKLRPQHTYMHMSVHCATHIDSPLHVVDGGPIIADIPIENCFGEAAVVDLTDIGELHPITAEDMEQRGKHVREGDIVLLKTGWTEKNAGGNTEKMAGLPKDVNYWNKGPYPTRSMAEWMVKKKVKAVGFDCPNECTQYMDKAYECTRTGPHPHLEDEHVHRIHLSHGILAIEFLCNLTAIKKDRVMFFAVPLKIKAEGAPIRAFAIEEE